MSTVLENIFLNYRKTKGAELLKYTFLNIINSINIAIFVIITLNEY